MRIQFISLGLASAFLLNAFAPHATAADSVLGPVIQGASTLAASSTFANLFGSARITMTPRKYEHFTSSSYGTLKSENYFSVSVDYVGTVRYYRKWSVLPAGDGNSGTSTAPFDFGPGSYSNPTTGVWIPFGVRRYSCSLPFGDFVYTYTIQSKIQWEISHTYAVNPMYMSPYTNVSINLLNWAPRLRDCSNFDTDSSTLRKFKRPVANNGVTLVVIPDGEIANLEFTETSGIGLTF